MTSYTLIAPRKEIGIMASALALKDDAYVFERMLRSNMQPEEKSTLAKWAEMVLGPISDIRIKDAPGGALSAIRQGSEGLAVAALAAYAHVNLPTGLDVKGAPIDGVGGVALLACSAFMGHSELGTDARNLASDAMTICAFRKLTDVFARARASAGKSLFPHLVPGGSFSGNPANDPVAAAAADL
jgi:hypothetical protein